MSAPFVVLNVQTAVGSAHVLEVAAVVLDARGLFELERFSSLIAPSAADKGKAVQHAAITARETQSAPAFEAIAAHLHRIVSGKIWCVWFRGLR